MALWRQDFRRFLRGNYRAHKIKNTNIYTTQITTQWKKREDEIIKSLNYTRCSKEYNIIKKSVFDGNLINIIVVKDYDSNAEVIDCSNIVWALHAMLVDNEVSLDRINKIINDVEVNRKNVCRILYFIYLCKIKLYIDRYLVFDYSNLYERIKQKKEFTQLRCYSTLINEIENFQR